MKFSLRVFIPEQRPERYKGQGIKQQKVEEKKKRPAFLREPRVVIPAIAAIVLIVLGVIGMFGFKSGTEKDKTEKKEETASLAVTKREINLKDYSADVELRGAGKYTLSGDFENMIVVQGEKDEKVELDFRNVTIKNKENAITNQSQAKLELSGNLRVESEGVAVDSYTGFTLKSGEFLLLGRDMLEFPELSSQSFLAYSLDKMVPAGTEVRIEDEKGKKITEFEDSGEFRTLIYSRGGLEKGEYKLFAGENVVGVSEIKENKH